MQSFPYAAGPMSAGGAPVSGIPPVAGLGYPPGVNPSLTQYPTTPPAGYPPTGFPAPNPYMMPQGGPPPALGTYQGYPGGPPPAPGPYQGYPGSPTPPVTRMPGPAMLGPGPGGGTAAGAGGVPGVSMGSVSGVAPPAATGGPHPLPVLPQIPLPQGFPNPFDVRQLGPGGPVPQGAPGPAPGPPPGMQTLTGPQGYLPGLGYFGMPNGQGQPGLPGPAPGQLPAYGSPPQAPPMPGRLPMPPAGPPGTAFPVLPGAQQAPMHPMQPMPMPPQVAPMMAQQAQGNPAQAHPFWLQLAWQLVQTPAVKNALGEHFDSLLKDEARPRTLQVAASCLAGPELQAAFRSMTAGSFEQTRFTELFADRLRGALQSVGAVAAR